MVSLLMVQVKVLMGRVISSVVLLQDASDANVTNWDTAYGWGDHSQEGYLTSYNDEYTTGVTFNSSNGVLTFTRNDGDQYTVNLVSTLSDVTVTGYIQ